jgi:hypothetical protein
VELRSFAAKDSQTVENDRENISGERPAPAFARGIVSRWKWEPTVAAADLVPVKMAR